VKQTSGEDVMGSERTIIDVLMHGNKELFHSAMIAWLLDPRAEHGFGDAFLRGLAACLRDETRARKYLAAPVESVKTEVKEGRHRLDIVITCADGRVIIENKVKSVGSQLQLEKYENEHW
jgi:hypothetical protein